MHSSTTSYLCTHPPMHSSTTYALIHLCTHPQPMHSSTYALIYTPLSCRGRLSAACCRCCYCCLTFAARRQHPTGSVRGWVAPVWQGRWAMVEFRVGTEFMASLRGYEQSGGLAMDAMHHSGTLGSVGGLGNLGCIWGMVARYACCDTRTRVTHYTTRHPLLQCKHHMHEHLASTHSVHSSAASPLSAPAGSAFASASLLAPPAPPKRGFRSVVQVGPVVGIDGP
jgi:hypothetical protein